jgi:hypothetical protein
MTLTQKQAGNTYLQSSNRLNKYHYFQLQYFIKNLIFIGFKCLNIKHLPSEKDNYFYASYAEAY